MSKKLYQQLLWIPLAVEYDDGRKIVAPIDVNFTEKERPRLLWMLYKHEDINNPPELPYFPKHLHNAFLEDYVHDWNIYGDNKKLKYYSRVSNGGHWVLLEFEQSISEYYRLWN